MSEWTLNRASLRERDRAPEFLAAVRAAGNLTDNKLTIDQNLFSEICARYPLPARKPGLGDRVERLVKPVARLLGLKCLDGNGKLKPGSPCAKRRDKLNKLTQK